MYFATIQACHKIVTKCKSHQSHSLAPTCFGAGPCGESPQHVVEQADTKEDAPAPSRHEHRQDAPIRSALTCPFIFS